MSYLLIKKGGQQPSKGPPANRNNGHRRNNPTLSSVQRRPGGGGGSSGQSWRNPASARNGVSIHHHSHNDGSIKNKNDASNQQRRHGMAVVNDEGGQVQLQRTAPSVQRQQQVATTNEQVQHTQGQQQQQRQQQQVVQGLVSMDEVYADLQILEQQRQESERKLASARLHQKQKKTEQSFLEIKLCELKSQNGGLRVELERNGNQLSLRHRELLETQTKAENSRKDTHRFDAKLKRVIGVARLLGTYRNKIENAMIALNETVTRLNFAKGQEMSKLKSAVLRRDDAKHRRDLLQQVINANTAKGRAIAEEISKIRNETGMNEQDLSAAQQMESQTKLRVETIEHEVMLERTRHADAVVNLEFKSKELDELKGKTTQSIVDKIAMIETKKSELHKIWEKCTELRKSESHDVFPEPTWGTEQAPSLDVARVRVRVNCEEEDLKAMTSTRETLRKDVADLDALVGSNTINAAEKCAKAVALQRDAEKTRAEESSRKAEILNAVEDADFECEEVEKLRNSIHDLTTTQEKDTTDLKLKLEDEENNISAMEAEIASSLDELASINTQSAEHRVSERVKNDKLLKEIAGAKRTADMVKTAYERAQNNANSFSAIPDGELALQMKIMDESEQQVVDNANRERDEIVESEPLLEKLKLDFNSDVSVEEQKEAGMNYLRRHCLDYLETAKIERQVRMEHAMDAYLEGVQLHEQEELQRRKEEEERLAKIEEESRLAAEAHLREKEEEDEEEEERRREEERAASIVAAKNARKKKETRRREERRAAANAAEIERKKEKEAESKRFREEAEAKAAEIERKKEKEAEAKRRREEAEEVGERRREEERAASILAAENEQKKEEAKRREYRRAAAKAAEIERRKEKESEVKAEAKRRREEEEVKGSKKEEIAADSAVTASSKADHKGKHSSIRSERDGKGAAAATELQRQKDEEHFQESQKKQLAADAADKAKRRQEREARRELELENMRARSKEMQKQLKAEEEKHEDRKRNENHKQGADRKRREELQSRKSLLEMTDLDGMDKEIDDDAKKRARKSYSKVEALKLNKPSKADTFHEKRVRNETLDGAIATSEHKSKRAKSSEAAVSSKRDSSSGLAKSAIKLKDSRLPKTTSSVRFDTTADRPKLDIFTSGVHGKENKYAKKKSSTSDKSSSSKPGSQTSGISSCEVGGGGRRRKKSSVGGKSKANVLAMKGFDDDGGFL